MKLTKNADSDKYGYSGNDIAFYARSQFSLSNDKWGKNVVIFGMSNSWSTCTGNRIKNILILDDGSTDGLDHTTVTAEVKYSVSITKSS